MSQPPSCSGMRWTTCMAGAAAAVSAARAATNADFIDRGPFVGSAPVSTFSFALQVNLCPARASEVEPERGVEMVAGAVVRPGRPAREEHGIGTAELDD